MSDPKPSFGLEDIGPLAEFARVVNGALMCYRLHTTGKPVLFFASEGAHELWGLPPERMIKENFLLSSMASVADRLSIHERLHVPADEGTSWSHEWQIQSATGKITWLRGVGGFHRESDGGGVWAVFVNDVTDSVRVREMSLVNIDRLRKIFDSIPSLAVQCFTPTFEITYWNQGSEILYGYSAAEVMGRNIIELLVLEHDRERLLADSVDIMSRGYSSHSDVYWLKRKDGTTAEVSVSLILMDHPDDGPLILGIVFDLTERRRAEEQRIALQAQLRESQKLEALGTLAGGIAHDFNNILAAIMGNTRLALQDAEGLALVEESLGEIAKATHRARDLVQRILSFSRRQSVERKLISLVSVLEESLTLLRATVPKSIAIEVSGDRDVPQVLADPSQLHQVFLNLCTNAVHAMEGSKNPCLTVSFQAHAGPPPSSNPGDIVLIAGPVEWPRLNVHISIADNGIGMDRHTMERIFEPFFTTKPPGFGTGLGMAVVHGILKDHEAAIIVVSKWNVGTTFHLYFRAASDGECEFADSAILPHDEAVVEGTIVLLVDDDLLVNQSIKKVLERGGCIVKAFTDPIQALCAIEEGLKYDLAVVDYSMPGLNGLDFARAARELNSAAPIVLASGFFTDELRRQADALGIQEVIDKPNSGGEILSTVGRLSRRT